MSRLRNSPALRAVLLLALSAWLSGCQNWAEIRPVKVALSDQAARPADERDDLRLLVGEDEQAIEGRLATLTPDSVVLVRDASTLLSADSTVTISTDSVVAVHARIDDGKRVATEVLIFSCVALVVAGTIVLVNELEEDLEALDFLRR